METYFGTVRFYNEQRGYGFIRQKNNEDVYFHVSEWPGTRSSKKRIAVGTLVEFELGPWKTNTVAKNIQLLSVDDPNREQPTPSDLTGAGNETR